MARQYGMDFRIEITQANADPVEGLQNGTLLHELVASSLTVQYWFCFHVSLNHRNGLHSTINEPVESAYNLQTLSAKGWYWSPEEKRGKENTIPSYR